MKIIFIPSNKDVELLTESPIPSKKSIPDWYKKSPVFDPNNYQETVLKQCMPFFDATTSGYIQRTWKEIFIGFKNNELFIDSADGPNIINVRKNSNLPVNNSYYPVEFVWERQWSAKLPKGFSMLVTHPHNRLDLPFTTLSGIVDGDEFYHTPSGNIPFYVHKDFSGFIPIGTPMYQIFPFKRESWESYKETFNELEILKRNNLIRRKFYGSYRDLFWQKKSYS